MLQCQNPSVNNAMLHFSWRRVAYMSYILCSIPIKNGGPKKLSGASNRKKKAEKET